MDMIEILANYGLIGIMLAWFMRRDAQRDERDAKRDEREASKDERYLETLHELKMAIEASTNLFKIQMSKRR